MTRLDYIGKCCLFFLLRHFHLKVTSVLLNELSGDAPVKNSTLQSLDIFDKLNYLKLNYRDPLVTNCTDKYSVRDYVSQMGHSDILNEIYGVYSSFVEIDFDLLPSKFFLKCNHTSGANYFYDKDRTIDVRALEKFNFFLKNGMTFFNESGIIETSNL